MPDDKTTQDPEEKGQEEEKEQEKEEKEEKDPVDEQGALFSEGFADATKKIKADAKKDPGEDSKEASEEKGGEGDKDKSAEKEDGPGNKGKKTAEKEPAEKGEGGEEGKAEKEIKERADRLKKIMDKTDKEEGDGEDPPPKKKAAKSKAKEKEKEKEDEGEGEDTDPLAGVELTENEKDFLADMPEFQDILKKVFKKAGKGGQPEGISQEIVDHLTEQDNVIANLRTQVALSRLVPDYEEIVYDGNKTLETGERAPNPVFWTWLKEQPDLYQGLALSENPRDNAAVLKYYKEDQAKKKLSEKDKQTKEKLGKTKDLHSHSANASKTAKKKSGGVEEDDFSGGFAEATKKIAAERQ